MAKWGEGDPRWIVEERADAHNVNNWHWRERDATAWSQSKLKELLKGVTVSSDFGTCSITEIESCEGEASVSNRKKKIICFYEFVIKAIWKGSLKEYDGIIYKGQLEIPNLSEENDADDIDVIVSFKKDQQKCDKLKELMRLKGTEVIREKLQIYMDSLKNECASSIQVPAKEDLPKATAETLSNPTKIAFNKLSMDNSSVPKSMSQEVGTRIPTKKLLQTETFMTTVDELYKALTMKDRIQAWSRSPIEHNAKPKELFRLFDGNVTGEYLELVENKKIVMKWRLKSWPDAHYSTVTLKLKQILTGTELDLEQTSVPQDSLEMTKQGWKNYYWQSIKLTFGYSTQIF